MLPRRHGDSRSRDIEGEGDRIIKPRELAISDRALNRIACALNLLVLAILLLAGWAMAQTGDIYIYPAKGQDNKQDEDRYDCHSWAVSQTRI